MMTGGGDYYPPPFVLVLLCTVSFIMGFLTRTYARRPNTHPDTVLSENPQYAGCILTQKSILGLLLRSTTPILSSLLFITSDYFIIYYLLNTSVTLVLYYYNYYYSIITYSYSTYIVLTSVL